MLVIPAIDLKDGMAVRLYKGEMNSAKVYGEAVDFAKQFEDFGAEWIHIVDLNGAFAGIPKNIEQIKKIRESCNLKIELGGGIRDEDTIKQYLSLGIDRLILGSIALKNPTFVIEMAKKYPIAVGIDAKNGNVSIDGWANTDSTSAISLASKFKGSKIETIICTDINKDGTGNGINLDFTKQIAQASEIPTIASGGFRSDDELEMMLSDKYISAVIVGKAFYEGWINLRDIFVKYQA